MYEPDGDGSPTQFGRAMNELDVELICANSPQAKGRVERANGTLQDRLVKALRLADVGDIDAANRFLADSPFLAELNERFRVAAASDADLHRLVRAVARASVADRRVARRPATDPARPAGDGGRAAGRDAARPLGGGGSAVA